MEMISIPLTILLTSLIANLILGGLVISRDPKSATNRLFFFLVIAMSIWGTMSYLSFRDSDTLLYARLVLMFAVLFATLFFYFVLTFPNRNKMVSLKLSSLSYIWTLVVMLLTLSPWVFSAIQKNNNNGVGSPVVAPGIALFGLTVIFYDFGGLIVLAKKTFKSKGEEKIKRLYLWIGLTVMLVLIILSQFILPTFFANTSFIPYATVFILPFIAATSYAIIKHRLLDIRAAAARALTYLLSLFFIAIAYGLLVFGLTSIFTTNISVTSSQRGFYIGFALLTAVIYQSVKKFFDRITNKIFFKDSYDPQLFIDHLNDVLVQTIQLEDLLHKTSGLVSNTLKSSYVEFVLTNNETDSQPRVVSTSKHTLLSPTNATELIKLVTHLKSPVVSDELIDEGHETLRQLLNNIDAAAVVRLATHDKRIGYLVLGLKQSGDAYLNRDLILLSIISDEISLAIQNALRFEEIQQFNITLQQKIDDATHQLRKANDKLRALDETKDEFISMASHQLRTPLTSVKGYVSMVLEGDAGKVSSPQKKLLDQAFLSSQRMVYLIADLLNVSRLRTGKFVIDAQPTNLADLVEGEINQLTETAKGRGLELTFVKPKDFPTLMLDETKTRQVIMNFADNAIYYTPSGGHISVNLVETPESVELTVVDDGLGVPKHDQHYMFTKFYRAGNAKKARPDGTGLGLFMAKKVIIAQGGAIIFKSEEGKGSTFGFSFPKAKLKVQGVSDKAK